MKLDDDIKRINEKVHLLLNRFVLLKKENEKLNLEVKQLKTKDAEKNKQIELLLQRVEILKASKSDMTADDRKAFEKRLNQYLREVERCITLLQE